MRLSDLATDEKGVITKVMGRGAFRKRITEMGFVKGKEVKVIKNAPLKDPIEYNIMGYNLTLRRSEASLIEVLTDVDVPGMAQNPFNGVFTEELLVTPIAGEKGKTINVAMVGNPNAGKTTIFNYASHSRERVGNYSGVTVESKTATFRQNGYIFNIADLPGTYSLSAYSPEELYVRDFIIDRRPDIVINIIDASNLERNLYLTSQLIDMGVKVVIGLNMYDELQGKQDELDFVKLGKMMGIPIVPTVGARGGGIKELFDKVINVYNDQEPLIRHIHISYGAEIELSIRLIQEKIEMQSGYNTIDKVSSRFLAIKLLEKDNHVLRFIINFSGFKEINNIVKTEISRLEALFSEDSETLITDARYGFIAGALKETFIAGALTKRAITDVLDTFLTHKLFGFPVFILFMWVMFSSTFILGDYPMNWIESGVDALTNWLVQTMPAGSFKELLTDGIIAGVGGVIVFLPNILILFLFISFMEDTGYMARVVFIMDRLMHKIGLHGKSFIPLVMGFGCNVPAIMATRTIENRKNRLMTMLINPFMSCSARLPVYLLLIGAIFPKHQASLLFMLYFLGILLAITMAVVFKKTLFKGEDVPFVMELPPYRMPTLRSILKHMWHKASQYLKKMGGVILLASIIVWALGHYPLKVKYSRDYDAAIQKQEVLLNAPGIRESTDKTGQQNIVQQIKALKLEKQAEKQEKSYIGRIGKFVEPALHPLGFDWRMGVSLLSGVAAKEIVVSTLGVLYQADAGNENTGNLPAKIQQARFSAGSQAGQKVFNSLSTLSYLVFILIYFPCVAVIAAINKESGSWKWALFTIFYTTGLAWLLSLAVYQVGSLFI